MSIKEGCVVRSVSGRDAGGFFVVLQTEGDFAWIADGKVHRLAKPKKKRLKHLRKTNAVIELSRPMGDRLLRQAMNRIGQEESRLSPM